MLLMIVGTGAMGKTIETCAKEDDTFDEIIMVEPTQRIWPLRKADLIIDFSHPDAIKGIYEYCRNQGGGIPVVIGTTGYESHENEILEMLRKICPVVKNTNFSRGIAAMNELVKSAKEQLHGSDIAVEEIHHTKKKDAPSGTAKTLCDSLEIPREDAVSLRIGTVPGQHTVYFALEDEVIEIKHTAFSKKIFAMGALEEGKKLL